MRKIIEGVLGFQSEIYPRLQGQFEELGAKPQSPHALLITCSDSRISPNLLTRTDPGELFLVRNAGNIIPPHGATDGGEGATVEFAVRVLGIRHLIVCGHYNCGAMNALIEGGDLSDLPAVKAWFRHAESTRQIMRRNFAHLTGAQARDVAVEQNVLVQLNNLRTLPSVAVGLADGSLHLHGWTYRIETGEVLAHDGAANRFRPLREMHPGLSPDAVTLPVECLACQAV